MSGVLGVRPSEMIRRGRYLVEVGAVAALAVVKLWLTYGRPLCPRYLLYDDLLFLCLADGIVQAGWLGPYDQLTLVKVPVYPLFIAANLSAALPILLTQEVVYLLGCGAMTLALAPVLRNRVARVATFAICVFNPITLSRDPSLAAAGAVLMREPLYASLAFLVSRGSSACGPIEMPVLDGASPGRCSSGVHWVHSG